MCQLQDVEARKIPVESRQGRGCLCRGFPYFFAAGTRLGWSTAGGPLAAGLETAHCCSIGPSLIIGGRSGYADNRPWLVVVVGCSELVSLGCQGSGVVVGDFAEHDTVHSSFGSFCRERNTKNCLAS